MKSPFSHTRGLGLLLFLLALALRAVYYIRSEANPLMSYPVLDESYYIDFGNRVASGFLWGEGRVFFMDPLYGYLLGLVFAVCGENLDLIRILQVLLDSANAVMVLVIGTRLWSRTAGLCAGVLYATYKVSFFYSLLILKTTVSITLSLAFVILLLHVVRAGRAGRWFLLGLLAAAMVYLHANLLALAPMVIFVYWFVERPNTFRMLAHTACFLVALALVLSAGAYRNYRVGGEWVWLNTQSGRLLYSSNNPENLTGRYNVPHFARPHPEESEADFHMEAERKMGVPLSAQEVSRYWTKQTLSFLEDRPQVIPELLSNKLLGTISQYEIPVNHSYETSARLSGMDRWPLPTFAFVFALGVPGLSLGLARKKETLWLILPIATSLVTIVLFYTSSRFRMPAVPFLMLGAGIGVDRFLHWIKGREILKPAIFFLAFLLLYSVSMHGPRPMPTGTEQFYLAKAYWSQASYTPAEKEALEGAKMFPGQARFPALLGMIALSQGRYADAIRHSATAIEIDPGYADAHHNLGLGYLLVGRAQDAVHEVQRALNLQLNVRYFFTLGKAKEALGKGEEAIRLYTEYLNRSRPSDPYRKDAENSIALIRGRAE